MIKDHRSRVMIIAFLEQDNLGVGYMASVLLKNDIDVRIVDFRIGKEEILREIDEFGPVVVGFSIIFQYHIDRFRDLLAFLRSKDIDAHFCAGGHYPSLRPHELFDLMPDLDSIVLYEGEYTFLDLVRAVREGSAWNLVEGIAWRGDGRVRVNPLRPLEKDLDEFPLPVRQPLREFALGKKYSTILAGRGCLHNCSFCSIREFYSGPPGPLKRLRDPRIVVREMELLHERLGCSVFMFQDDDFPLAGKGGREWARKFCGCLKKNGLGERIMWKINCRADEVDPGLFTLMKREGLFFVYLGIENGTEDGLALMNKHLGVEANVRAVSVLNDLGINYDFGFMLFHPDTTFDSIFENLEFLRSICGDGSSPVTFCKMLPYAGTAIEDRLEKEGRLTGRPGFRDYSFSDPAMDAYCSCLSDCFADWIRDHDGVLNSARWARFHLAVLRRYWPESQGSIEIESTLQKWIAESNNYFLRTAADLARLFSSDTRGSFVNEYFTRLKSDVGRGHAMFKRGLHRVISDITLISREGPACEDMEDPVLEA